MHCLRKVMGYVDALDNIPLLKLNLMPFTLILIMQCLDSMSK